MPSKSQNDSFLKALKEKALFVPFHFVGLSSRKSVSKHSSRDRIGAPPGIEHLPDSDEPPSPGSIFISCIDLSESEREESSFESIDQLIATPKPSWSVTRWIDIQGIHPYVLKKLQSAYGIHSLAAEDALHVPQRPKIEDYDESLFIILKMLRIEDDKMINEQVSFFYLGDTIITIQEERGDVWDKVRLRTQKNISRFKKYGAPYLLYALIDAIIDHIFPFIDFYFETIDSLEQEILGNPTHNTQKRVHAIKRELIYLRQAILQMQNVTATLARDEYELFSPEVESYFRDVHDHTSQAWEALEMYRETANGLQDLYMAASSNRLNEVMKALTIMASLFLPLTFFAGVYGMNFEYIPELSWKYSYPVFWILSLSCFIGLLCFFKRKKWIGN